MRASQLSETEVSTVLTGQARISADSFNNQLGIPPSAQLPSYGYFLRQIKGRARVGSGVTNRQFGTGGIQAFGRTPDQW